MVKIKVKLRPSSIEGKAGSIYYYVSHKRKIRHIRTNIRIHPADWDEKEQRILSDADGGCAQSLIESDQTVLQRIVRELELRQREFTAEDITAQFRSPERYVSVLAFFKEQIQFLTDCHRHGTAQNYFRSANTLSEFLKGQDFRFSEFTPHFVQMYNDFLLRKGMVRNSLSFHMRILRAVYNKAVRCGYAEQTFPFRDVYTGIDRTRKRAVGEDVISRLIRLDLSDQEGLSFARDIFLFCFYTRGMAFIDVAYLQKSNIQDGIIRYTRRKTGQELAVRLEPCMQALIDRYAHAVRRSPYVFPILIPEESGISFRQYKNKLRTHNKRLARMSQLLGMTSNLSSYTSRHSWATMARNHNVPLSVISAGMGHSSERTTQIYLTSLESSLIDNANKGLLESFNQVLSVNEEESF